MELFARSWRIVLRPPHSFGGRGARDSVQQRRFTNTRSAINSGGIRKTRSRSQRRLDRVPGSDRENSAHFRGRDGLIPGYYYRRSATVWVSTVFPNGTATLQWISPATTATSTARGRLYRALQLGRRAAPGLSDALFNAALNVTPAPPAAVVSGLDGLDDRDRAHARSRLLLRDEAFERDGTRSVRRRTIQNLNLPQEPYASR